MSSDTTKPASIGPTRRTFMVSGATAAATALAVLIPALPKDSDADPQTSSNALAATTHEELYVPPPP